MGIIRQAVRLSPALAIAAVATLGGTTSGWSATSPAFGSSFGLNSPSLAAERISNALEALEASPAVREVLSDRNNQVIFKDEVSTDELHTVKFQSYYKGLEVFGALALQHQGAFGSQITDALSRFDLDVRPALSEDEAIALTRSLHLNKELAEKPVLKILPSENQNSAQLIYWVRLKASDVEGGYDVIIDAHSGQVIADVSHDLEIAPIDVYTTANGGQQVDPHSGAPFNLNPDQMDRVVQNSSASSRADESALRALDNAQKVLTYYSTEQGRNSFDNRGSTSTNVVHAGQHFANAFWTSDGNFMAYGDGDGTRTTDFTRGLDVAGHEMTHGVVQETAGLSSFSESGALNEALADFFGKMIEGKGDWVLGKDIFLKPAESQRGIRNIADPARLMTYYQDDSGHMSKRPFPTKMSEKFVSNGVCDGSNDHCFVHANSTIASHATYLIYNAIGRQSTQKIVYLALTQYLTPRSDMRMFASALVKACSLTLSDNECDQVRTQLRTVELL